MTLIAQRQAAGGRRQAAGGSEQAMLHTLPAEVRYTA